MYLCTLKHIFLVIPNFIFSLESFVTQRYQPLKIFIRTHAKLAYIVLILLYVYMTIELYFFLFFTEVIVMYFHYGYLNQVKYNYESFVVMFKHHITLLLYFIIMLHWFQGFLSCRHPQPFSELCDCYRISNQNNLFKLLEFLPFTGTFAKPFTGTFTKTFVGTFAKPFKPFYIYWLVCHGQ